MWEFVVNKYIKVEIKCFSVKQQLTWMPKADSQYLPGIAMRLLSSAETAWCSPMARLIQDKLKKPLANEILFGELQNGGTVTVSPDKQGQGIRFDYIKTDISRKCITN